MPKDTLRILYITTFYPTLDRPHHGIFFRDHAEALATKYSTAVLNCSVISIKEQGLRTQKDIEFEKKGVFTKLKSVSTLSHRLERYNANKLKNVALSGFKEIEKSWGKPDLIIAQCSLPAGELAYHIHSKTGIPFGLIEHFSFLPEQIKREKERMKKVYDKAVFLASVNVGLKKLIEETFRKSVFKIDNVLSDEFKLRENPLSSTNFRWLHVGYNDSKKGADFLEQLLVLRPDLGITLVGEGLDQYISPENHNVSYIKSATRSELVKIMLKHHAFLSVSRTETFGMAIAESLATGMPAVITKSGGPEQYFEKYYGYLCNPNASDILESMLKLEDKYAQFDSSKISSSILSKFGAANYIAQLEQIIQSVL